jgi:hypothetical protein
LLPYRDTPFWKQIRGRATAVSGLGILLLFVSRERVGKMGQEKSSAVMKKSKGSLRSIFMHADGVDICLMALGILGSVGDGFSTPLVLYISSKLMNNIGDASGSLTESFTHSINKVYISPFLFLSHTQT